MNLWTLGMVIGGTLKDNWALGWMSPIIEYKIFKSFFFKKDFDNG
jgi:hypothetical protein